MHLDQVPINNIGYLWYLGWYQCYHKHCGTRCIVCKLSLHTDCAPGMPSLCLGPTATTSSPTLVQLFDSLFIITCHFLWTNVFLLKKINDVYNPRWVAPLPGAQTMQEGLAQGHHYLHHQCCDDLVCICKTCSLWTSGTSTKATYYFDFSWPCYTGLVCKCCT